MLRWYNPSISFSIEIEDIILDLISFQPSLDNHVFGEKSHGMLSSSIGG